MNYIDLFVVVLLAWAAFKGVTKGLMMQATSLAALVLGIYAAMKLSGFTARLIGRNFTVNEEYLYLIGLGITFIAVFILVHLAGRAIQKLVEAIRLSVLNKVLGVIFAVFKMVLILGIVLAFIDRLDYRFPFLPEGTKENSFFFIPLSALAKELFPGLEYYSPEVVDPEGIYAILFL